MMKPLHQLLVILRSLISIAAEMGWKIHQMDVKTAFLNGIIQEEVYVE